MQGAKYFCDSSPLVEKMLQKQLHGNIVAAIYAVLALLLRHHDLFPIGNMTGFTGTKPALIPGMYAFAISYFILCKHNIKSPK
jgi:hypothetical protein